MKYFIDTEFIEGLKKPLFGKSRHFIDLISIGIVAEDGRTYYAISNEFRYKDADTWVQKNVIDPMYIHTVSVDARNSLNVTNYHKYFGKSNRQIAEEIKIFIHLPFINYGEITHEFYGYYADYDWVLLCSLFGRMIDLPKGFPMYCRDLKQSLDEKLTAARNSDFFTKFHIEKEMTLDEKLQEIKKHTQYPTQENEHNALDDAKWNKKLFDFINSI